MKTLACVFPASLAVLALVLSPAALATDYNGGQCPASGTASPVNCAFPNSAPINASAFSDTVTFYLGNWAESYGTWQYTATQAVVVNGAKTCGVRCVLSQYNVYIESATLDGVPMTYAPVNGVDRWSYSGSLSPGWHTVAFTGTAQGALYRARWAGGVLGVSYTLVQ